ncbi:CRISPR-associated endonuclease Cas2 [Clostridium thermobutyricum]|uniref:CRISPR-associated endonuclease Cas2 n=1 Tax=Clostridium thermobutyricum TaxID=29372 RepID=UPI0018AAFF25|nr:CRISPR-associated endonuclease Cas2 [Clostridium thermobutyricum]
MIIVSYDISDNKLRSRFSKYLSKYGHRLQYSVFELNNSNKILNNVMEDIKNRFEKQFSQADSIIIFNMSSSCKITRFGYAKNDDKGFIIIK